MTLELSYIAATTRLDRLDPVERMALELIALGQTEAMIATQLGITPRASAALCTAVFATLGLRPTAYLGRRALAKLTLRAAGRQKISEVPVSAGVPGPSSFRETER